MEGRNFLSDRRTVLKSLGLAGAGLAGASRVDTAAASSGEWDAIGQSDTKYSSFYDQYYRYDVGTGLTHIDSDTADLPYFHVFEFSTHGAIIDDDTDEFVFADGYYDANQDCDPPDDPRNASSQGFVVTEDTDIDAFVDADGDQGFIHPPTCEAEQKTVAEVGSVVLDLAVSALGSATLGAALTVSELADALTQDTIDLHDYTYSYPGGVGRGGAGAQIVIKVNKDTSGVVNVMGEFGDAEAGFDIFIDGTGYSVNPIDNPQF